MSRIHEALKKAEQEREAIQREAPPAGFSVLAANEPLNQVEEPVNGPVRTAGVVPVAPSGALFSTPFGIDSLMAKSVQTLWNPDSSTMLFLNGDDNVRGTEEFRTLRSRLYHVRERMPLKSVLVTSALPREGKSFTSANLAQVLVRQHGRRVLLIDADLRAPRLHQMLGTLSSPGLSDYLQGKSDELSAMQRGPLENFFFMPSGTPIGDPSELVGNGRMKTLLQRVGPLFDWIIIDSPPAVPVSDSGVLAKACDGVLLVVRSNSTPFDAARRAREEFPDQLLVGMVLNGTSTQVAPYSRYYYEAYEKQGKQENARKP
ncbi:MAG TPA: CpsD/CapB family tyrosine-protein kinase [Candidatus Sulfotelmatobacter sp.]